MTLDTKVVIGKPYPVREIFDYCRTLLNCPETVPVETGPEPGREREYRRGQKWLNNPCGIGLPAWLWLYYGADGPFALHEHDKYCATEVGGEWGHTQEDVDRHAADIAADPTENGWAAIEVSFDTAYGYRGDNGESCSDLHARLVTALGQWLDARGLPWKWQNEYTGEWFDRYDGLAEFGDAHRTTGADAWFRNVVLPAIAGGAPS